MWDGLWVPYTHSWSFLVWSIFGSWNYSQVKPWLIQLYFMGMQNPPFSFITFYWLLPWPHYTHTQRHTKYNIGNFGDFSGGSAGKDSACNTEDLVWSLGWDNPLEKGTATYSNVLDWRVPWTEEPGELHTVHGVAKSQTWLFPFHGQLLCSFKILLKL